MMKAALWHHKTLPIFSMRILTSYTDPKEAEFMGQCCDVYRPHVSILMLP